MELCLRSWNISNWRYQCLILGVSNKICFCIYTFKMWWCLGGGVTQLCKQFYMMVLGGDHSTMWTILYDGAWGGSLTHVNNFFMIPGPFEALNWNFGSVNKIKSQAFFRQNPTLKLLRIRQILQNYYILLQNNFLISQVRNILGPSKLSKFVSCQNKLIGDVIFRSCSIFFNIHFFLLLGWNW